MSRKERRRANRSYSSVPLDLYDPKGRMIIGEGLKLSFAGLLLGLVGAVWVGHAARSLLFGVGASDPVTFTSVSLLLTVVAVAACYFPARRAMKVEPLVALRQE